MIYLDPSRFPDAPPPPPIDPLVAREEKIANDTRVQSELNRFIAAKQDALFEAPDAYYRRQGRNAVDGAPQAIQRLYDIKDVLLDGLANDYQRKRLRTALDAHMTLAGDDIGRHAAEQSKVWQRQVALDRIDLLAKEAAFHSGDGERIAVLGIAAENAARAHARVGGAPPDPQIEDQAAAFARRRILDSATNASIVPLDSPSYTQVAVASENAYAACVAECSKKYEDGEIPRPKWFSGSDRPSLMRLCLRACWQGGETITTSIHR